MIVTPSTIFTIDGSKCFLVIICNEKGEALTDVARADTLSGKYLQIQRHPDGDLMYDRDGVAVTKELQCEQFFFTIATPCRCENPDTRSCGPICSGAAKE
jgi:hypothetical protein